MELSEGAAVVLTDMVRQGWRLKVPYGDELRGSRRWRWAKTDRGDRIVLGGVVSLGEVAELLHAGMLERALGTGDLPPGDFWMANEVGHRWVEAQPKGGSDE